MSAIHLSASEWISQFRRGAAATVEGQQHVIARLVRTGEITLVPVEVDEPDARCAWVDGQLDAEDLARVFSAYRGQPTSETPGLSYVRPATSCDASVYVCDEVSGMVYLLD